MIYLKNLISEVLNEGVLSKLVSIPDPLKQKLGTVIAKWYSDKRSQEQSGKLLPSLGVRLEKIKVTVEKLGFTKHRDMTGATEIELAIDMLYRFHMRQSKNV
jgi:hypothetical protein